MEIQSTPIVPIKDPLLEAKGVELWMKREDLNHPIVSGNKWRKLKYNLIEAKKQGHKKLLTFGGAYSNHIYAVAGAGKELGFETIGVIRGEAHSELNPTLSFAQTQGMQFHYMDRSTYREKDSIKIINLLKQVYGSFYLIPEGGTNDLALKGCSELAQEIDIEYDILCCPVGTGGTLAGLIIGAKGRGQLLGFSALKGSFLQEEVENLLEMTSLIYNNWGVTDEFCFGGYAKTKPKLLEFMAEFEEKQGILLDPIYTGKMMYGIYEMVKSGRFKAGTKIVAVHTGGLQGRAGFGLKQ